MKKIWKKCFRQKNQLFLLYITYPTSTRRHGNFAGVHTLLRILLSSNISNIILILLTVILCKQRYIRTLLPCNVTVVDLK
jgi:hypothetical protein